MQRRYAVMRATSAIELCALSSSAVVAARAATAPTVVPAFAL